MSASDLLGGLPEWEHGPNYLAKRFAVLTGLHTCYECDQATRVSAIGLAGYDERDGAWFISKPGQAFFPLSDEEAAQLKIKWIERSVELEDLGGAQASWVDRLLGCDRPYTARRRKRD